MSEYFIYYSSINMVGVLIFGIMLSNDCLGVDRQEKQLKYDYTLIAFILYFISDAIWSGVDSGVFPVNYFSVMFTAISNFIIMTFITYTWLNYVMAVEQIPNRNSRKVRVLLACPFVLSLIVLIVTYCVDPNLLIDEELKNTKMFDAFMVVIPYIYIIAVIVYTIKKARTEKNPIEKKKHIYIGLFPIMVVVGGLLQMVCMPSLPIFCFASTLLMLIFYIKSIDIQISKDPLTNLNNRGQLARYVAQGNNLIIDGRATFVVMMDVNDFKQVNDTYGHAEGDAALVIIAQALMHAVKSRTMPLFLGRYGGDEFVMIAHPVKEEELKELIEAVRENITARCVNEKKPYRLTVGVGYDELCGGQDTFQKCMKRADDNLYQDKERIKQSLKESM